MGKGRKKGLRKMEPIDRTRNFEIKNSNGRLRYFYRICVEQTSWQGIRLKEIYEIGKP